MRGAIFCFRITFVIGVQSYWLTMQKGNLALLLKFYNSSLNNKIYLFMSTQKIILGTISGVLAGVAVGLLVAPMSGEETRQKISEKADELGGTVKDKFTQITSKAGTKLDDIKKVLGDKVEGLSDDVREKIVNLLNSAGDATHAGAAATASAG